MKMLMLVLVTLSLFIGDNAQAGSHGGCGCQGGFYASPVYGGANGRPYYYNGVGRYPKGVFATPFRPWGGITPVRQFLFGRGRIRRQNRRAFLFGWR